MTRPSPRLTMSVDRAVRLAGLAHLDAAGAALARLADESDDEALHDFRVAVRRLRSTLRAYRDQLDDPVPKKLRRRLRSLQQATNPGRDAEVALAWLRKQRKSLTPRQRYGLDWLVARLDARREGAYAKAAGEVTRDFSKVARVLGRSLSRYQRDISVDDGEPATPLATAAATLVRRHAEMLDHELARVTSPDDQEAVHAARIAAKRLRYLLEPLRGEVEEVEPVITQLKRLQDVTGDMHDSQVLERDLGSALEAAAAERARRLYDVAAAGSDRNALRRAGRKDERPGLLALVQRAAAQRAELFAELSDRWLGGRAEPFFVELTAVAQTIAARAPRAVEIERKFLLRELPPRARETRPVEIEQGWLPGARIQERLRRLRSGDGDRLLRTIKHGEGIVRLELEEAVSAEMFAALWPLTEGRRLTKRRHTVGDGDLTWEIDEFTDRELVLAEVELPSAATPVEPPDWLARYVEREVTGEPEYLNVNLAR